MSRTFRLRRLPKPPGVARRHVDGGPTRWTFARYPYPGHEIPSWWDWGSRHEGDVPSVESATMHPFVRSQEMGHRRGYRIDGNRRLRRITRDLVRRWARLGDEYPRTLPGKLDAWDRWAVS